MSGSSGSRSSWPSSRDCGPRPREGATTSRAPTTRWSTARRSRSRSSGPDRPSSSGGGDPGGTPRLAATYAAEFNLGFATPEETAPQFDLVADACRARDRDPDSITLSVAQVVCCGATDADIARRASAIGRQVDELREHGLCGTPAEVVDKLGRFAAIGTTRVYLQVLDLADLDHLALLGAEVLPEAAGV